MYCTKCGKEIENKSEFCQFCGQKNKLIPTAIKEICWTCDYCDREFDTKKESDEHEKFCQLNSNNIIKSKAENSSGMGENSVIPDEIKGWSWGGFLWGWVWSIGNKTWIGLLALIPYLGFIMNIVLGIYGREWAWKNKKWENIEQFKKIQKRWVIIWFIIGGIFPLIAILSVAILATINPIEQSNKARDARVMNDSAEMLNAFERYYSINGNYPWNNTGLIRINNAEWMESLYSTGELKNSFRDKLSNKEDTYTLYSNGLDNYVCFNPKSKTNIEKAKTRCVTDTKINDTNLCLNNLEQICIP